MMKVAQMKNAEGFVLILFTKSLLVVFDKGGDWAPQKNMIKYLKRNLQSVDGKYFNIQWKFDKIGEEGEATFW